MTSNHVTESITGPKSWADVKDLMLAYDVGTWEMYERFGAAARKLLFSDEALSPEEKDELWQVSAQAAVTFCQITDPGKFPPPSEEDMTRAWASALDGQELQPAPQKEAPDAP